MDANQRLALEQLVRNAVSRDLDQMAGELASVRQEMLALQRLVGLPGEPPARARRREEVARLREQGLSAKSIAALVRCSYMTVVRDLQQLDVPVPAVIHGRDGRSIRARRPAGT